jgi:predicted transcriptional regulator
VDDQEGLDKLFFELASESRIGILMELQKCDAKMPEIARKLNLTHTETFRQLQRLSEALLVVKKPDGSYAITQNGKLLMGFSHSFEFVLKFRQLILTRDIGRIPYQFIDRIGELSEASLITDVAETVNIVENIIVGAEKFLLCMGRRPIRSLSEDVGKPVQKGVPVKVLFDEENKEYYQKYIENKYFEKRVIPTIPVVMVISEKCATINFLPLDNRQDMKTLYGQDLKILKWASDLFLYYWEQGKRCFPE